MTREFGRVVAAGGIAAAANWGSRFVVSRWMPFELAVVAAYVVGMCVAFALMRAFVFAAGDQEAEELARHRGASARPARIRPWRMLSEIERSSG